MFLGRLRVQTSQDFIQALGFVDNLTGRGTGQSCQQYRTGLHTPHICWHVGEAAGVRPTNSGVIKALA